MGQRPFTPKNHHGKRDSYSHDGSRTIPNMGARWLQVPVRAISIWAVIKRIAKLAFSLFYFVARECSRFVLRSTGRSPGQSLIILYYHGVPPTYRSKFRSQMESIRRSARVLPASYSGTLPSDRPNVAITFDDAYISVAE